jgi:two-component system response regulator NreC
VNGRTRVFICDDHALFRDGIRAILQAHPSIEVVGAAGDGRDAVERVKALRPHVVLMDLEMPELNGLEATRRIVASRVGSRVLILTLYDDEEIVARCMEAGATGYVLKDGPATALILAVEAVSRGERFLSPRALTKIVAFSRRGSRTRTKYELLTAREREVLKLLADGFSGKQIAARLQLSVKTVDAHKANLMRKLDLHDRASLVKYAIQRKLIRVPVLGDVR